VEGFFWFVGQGGYGIQIAPALAEAGAALVRTDELPARLVERGLGAAELSRARLADLPDLTPH
jgi:D-arginine dehydrogenase